MREVLVFLVTRPLSAGKKTAEKLEKLGIKTYMEPVFSIRFFPPEPLSFSTSCIIIITSMNGARAFCRNYEGRRPKIICVGEKTVHYLESRGFTVIHAAENVNALTGYIKSNFPPQEAEFVYIRGAHVKKDLKKALKDFRVTEKILYEAARKTTFSGKIIRLIKERKISAILFYSSRTAKIFARLAKKAEISNFLDKTVVFCLSSSIAAALGIPYGEIHAARAPSEKSLLELIEKYVDKRG